MTKNVLNRKRPSRKIISEMVRNFSEEILLTKDLGMSPSELFEHVARKVLQETKGYALGNTHFMNSLSKSSKAEMFSLHDSFVIDIHGDTVRILHQKKYPSYARYLDYIFAKSSLVA